MRVLHVIPSVSERAGGPSAAIVPMCRALQAQGVEVLLVTTDAGIGGTKAARTADYGGIPTIFFESQLGESFKYSRPLAAWLNANAGNFNAGHIHAVFNHACVAAARAFRKAGVPYVIRPLGTLDPWSMKQKSLRKRVFWSVVGEAMLAGAAGVHYTSEVEKEATESLLGVNHGRVIPLGVEAAPQSGFVRSHDPYVLVLSRLHPKKGLDVLIDAFLEIAPRFARWRLVIAGDGPAEQSLKQQAASAGDKIVFSGWLDGDDKEAILNGASLLVLPSYQENFGLCVMEALARSVPVVVSPHVNLAREIAAANAGWIAPVEKVALAATLAEALSNEDELSKRGRAGKLLSQRYSWERVAASLVELYTEITNGRACVQRV
ncbi:MAG TPA: glycosyltransferase [Pyrinomonadaceae bacterium]|nr:glycosyltransferase [Pyrinomonadaceae bacterium]